MFYVGGIPRSEEIRSVRETAGSSRPLSSCPATFVLDQIRGSQTRARLLRMGKESVWVNGRGCIVRVKVRVYGMGEREGVWYG